MSKVNVLPPDIISKIAAGEVIDRPASVVKELLENALDAGATSIELILQEGGKKLIRLIDDGTGIEKDDLETIFLRHATSKISKSDDLFDIHSLGFRGEALYSVAAIADIELSSKVKDDDSAWSIHMRGCEKLDFKPAAFSEHGTIIDVKELFFNTPARKKFLKSNTAELNQILNVFIPYCLLQENTRFLLKNDDKVIIDVTATDDKKARIGKVLNLDASHLLETTHTFEELNTTVHLIIGNINIVRGRRDLQFQFVNGRPVENKNISFHINNVCRLIFPPAKFPSFCVFIDLPAENVDVNIHPTKREVKLSDEQRLCSMVRNLTENLLMNNGQAKQAANVASNEESSSTNISRRALSQASYTTINKPTISADEFFSNKNETMQPTEEYNFPKGNSDTHITPASLFGEIDSSLQNKFQAARFIGFFRKKYILFEYETSLLMVDQHAAQERINYERFIMQMEKGAVEAQRLLAPELIKLNAKELLAFDTAKNKLNTCGFECTLFDEQTIAIHSYPVLISEIEISVRNLLAGDNIARCDHTTIASRACKASIRAYEKMSAKEALFQRDELLRCLDPFTCPHGRPTVIEMTENYLDKQFLRI
ncbi:MAG: DNA mismatch repair protein MutL [Lysobacterales bacterium]|jgi:DNA mismatch repair protein MutL